MSSKRNHHKQPNFYLKGFKSSDEGNPKVWVYEKGKPFYDGKTEKLQNPKHLTTEKAARTRDFYAFEKEDGTKEYDKYEDLLRDEFEEPAKPVIERIRRFEEIDENEKILLSRYVASMITRGDWFQEIYKKESERIDDETERDIEIDAKEIVAVAKKQGNKSFSNIEKVKDEFRKGIKNHEEKTIVGEHPKELSVRYANKFADELMPSLHITFLISPCNIPFLTSDNPVCHTGFQNSDVKLFFPVSSKICLFADRMNYVGGKWKKQNNQFWTISDKDVEDIRNFICSKAVKEIYYSQKAEWLVKFINNRIVK